MRAQWVLIFFGALLALATVIVPTLRRAVRAQREAGRVRQAHPGAPWRWRDDWERGRSESTATGSAASSAWTFAILWNLVSAPLIFVIPPEIERGNRMAAVGLLFPLVGVAMVAFALRQTLLLRKFGVSTFEMAAVPCVPGRRLTGDVRTSQLLVPEAGFHLTLTCLRRAATRSGKDRSVSETILWREDRTMTRPLPSDDPSRTLIPVSFELPADSLETTLEDPDDRILWILGVAAKLPGLDYRSEFEVPVFRPEGSRLEASAAARTDRGPEPQAAAALVATAGLVAAAGPVPAADPDPMAEYEAPEEPHRPPDGSGIIVRPSSAGGTEFCFSALRNPGVALGFSLFTLLWFGTIWLQLRLGAPKIFPLVTGAFGLLLAALSLGLLAGTSRVVIEAGQVRLTRGLLGIGPTRTFACGDLQDVTTKIVMQTGGRSGTPYYGLAFIDGDGEKTEAARDIKDKRVATWLAGEMKRLIVAGR